MSEKKIINPAWISATELSAFMRDLDAGDVVNKNYNLLIEDVHTAESMRIVDAKIDIKKIWFGSHLVEKANMEFKYIFKKDTRTFFYERDFLTMHERDSMFV